VVAQIKTPPVTHFGECGATQPGPQSTRSSRGSQDGRTSDFGILCRVCVVTTTVLCGVRCCCRRRRRRKGPAEIIVPKKKSSHVFFPQRNRNAIHPHTTEPGDRPTTNNSSSRYHYHGRRGAATAATGACFPTVGQVN